MRCSLVRAAALTCLLALFAAAQAPGAENLARILAEGDPMQMGERAGAQCAGVIQALHPQFIEIAEALMGLKRSDIYTRAGKMSIPIEDRQIREMQGMALGAELDFEDILFLNLFYALTETRMGCRQLVAWGDATADGALLHARNLDWRDYKGDPLKKYNLILNGRPQDRIEFVAITWPGMVGVLTGTNRNGLSVAFNRLPDGHRIYRLAEPVFLTLRRVLERCSTLDEALASIEHAEPLGNGSIMISSVRDKSALVIEIVDGKLGVRRPAGNMICNANHATPQAGLTNATRRDAEMPALPVAREIGLPLSPRKMRAVMSHPKVLQDHNIRTVIFEPEKNRMHLACGRYRAALGPYETFVLFPEEPQAKKPAEQAPLPELPEQAPMPTMRKPAN